jgi:hypothetical protein
MPDEVEAAEQQVQTENATLAAERLKRVERAEKYCFSLVEYESMHRQEEGVWFTPRHPDTGRPIPWRLLVAGIDSIHYANAMNALTALRQEKTRIRGGDPMAGFDYLEVKDGEVIIANHIVLDWEPLVEADGTPIPCNDKTKPRHFKEHRWLADQVIMFCRNRANFLRGADQGAV